MNTRRCAVGLIAVAMLGLNGCAALWLTGGAVGGYAASKDAVIDHFDLSQEMVFQRSLAVAQRMGHVTLQDATNGLIKATIDGANVTIRVRPLTEKTVELSVRSRKYLMPKVSVSQEVHNEIDKGLK